MANFIPLANGASLGSYLVNKDFFVKKGQTETVLAPKRANFFWNSFDFLRGFVYFFFQLNLLPPYSLRWQGAT